jgi:hypothetical protein
LTVLSWEDGLNALVVEGIEAIVFRTVNDQPSLWELVLPEEVRRLPEELARVDALLDDTAFFAPFVPFFDLRMGRPSTPMETYLRLMLSQVLTPLRRRSGAVLVMVRAIGHRLFTAYGRADDGPCQPGAAVDHAR